MDTALSLALRFKDHFLSRFGSPTISFPDQSRVAPLSRERGIGCGRLASSDATKSSPGSARLTDGAATFAAGGMGALPGEDEAVKND